MINDDNFYRVDIVGRDHLGTTTTFRYATKAYCTIAGGTSGVPSGVFVDGRVSSITCQRDLYSGQGGQFGEVGVAHGEIALTNQDGGLDILWQQGFDAGDVEIWRIQPDLSEFLEFKGKGEQFELDLAEARLQIRDYTFVLAQPLQPTKYAGNNSLPNGLEGTATDLLGKPKPICIGINYNIEPVLVNTSRLIYQFHETSSSTVGFSIAVKDMGVALTRGSDYTSQSDMETNAPLPGQFRVWINNAAGSYFRLGATPAGTLTADVTNPPQSGVNDNSWAQSFFYIVSTRNSVGITTGENRVTSTAAAGFYWSDEITIIDALREVVRCVNGSLQCYPVTVPYPTVSLTVQRLELASITPELTLDQTNISDIKRIIAGDDLSGIPPWRIQVGWQRNRTVMSRDQLAGSVIDSDVQFYSGEYRYVKVDSAVIQAQFPRSQVLDWETNLAADPTSDLAAYFHSLQGNPADVYVVTIPMSLLDALSETVSLRVYRGITLGKTFTLQYPRFNLSGGVNVTVMGYVLDFAARVAQVVVWSKIP